MTGVAAAYSLLPSWAAVIEQVPAVSSAAVVPEIVQTDVVVDTKLIGNPELAVAVSARVELALCAGIEEKVMVCCELPVPTPLSWIVCVALAFSAESFSINMPLNVPAADGLKLMGKRQD